MSCTSILLQFLQVFASQVTLVRALDNDEEENKFIHNQVKSMLYHVQNSHPNVYILYISSCIKASSYHHQHLGWKVEGRNTALKREF